MSDDARFSIIIITYARDEPVQENLAHLLPMIGHRSDCELVLVDNNEDDIDRSHFLEGFARPVYSKLNRNAGVSGGRNAGMEAASGQYLVFVDDDAYVHPENFLDLFEQEFLNNEKLGIIAVKSINFYKQRVMPHEFPHTDKSRDVDQPFKTFRFIGVCHAFRREMIEKVGLYDADFFYGAEEFDMSYRALSVGYEMAYYPKVWVVHKQAKAGRLPGRQVQRAIFQNKLKVAFCHLPAWILPVNVLLWTGFTLYKSKGKVNVFSALAAFIKWAFQNQDRRHPLPPTALAYIRSVGGNVWK